MKKIALFILGTAVVFTSCKPAVEPTKPGQGEANFSTYVAIGNSLTAGFADNTLYRSGQENSYPAMLAEQFKLVGGGDFKQPLLPGNAGWPSPKLILGPSIDCLGDTSLGPIPYTLGTDTAGSAESVAASGPYNNVGVPGIRCIDYDFVGYGALNPYSKRFFPSPTTNTAMEVALLKVPTFFSVWLGSNDVLGYATGGGVGSENGVAMGDISNPQVFEMTYNKLINKLVEFDAKGVLINIPDVTTIPFFTTIPTNGLVLTATQAAQLTAAYATLGITFSEGPNPFIIADASAPGGMRQIKQGEYILLTVPGNSLKCGGMGSMTPIPDQYVLDVQEVAAVKAATTQFNTIIANAAAAHGLALVDANGYMAKLQSGITWSGVKYSPTFATGGAFSLDGVHPTERGYALIANEIIRQINSTYLSTIPLVDVNKYHGVLFP